MRNYFNNICILTPTILLLVIVINWFVNPYDIWSPPKIGWLNKSKSELVSHERIFKTIGLINKPASIAILGTSRSDNGLNPDHPVLMHNAINLAIGAQTYKETRMLFEKLAYKKIDTVIIGMDFFFKRLFF